MIADKYTIKDGKVTRKKTCPRCGAGVFLADHENRLTCGKCGYTEFKKNK
ncbi:MAG: 30S ribosomal protein S27ae [Euryarchaeota archaeon]|nr:30S ribosomal protein S27ae [Euryarchaeota archaeon]